MSDDPRPFWRIFQSETSSGIRRGIALTNESSLIRGRNRLLYAVFVTCGLLLFPISPPLTPSRSTTRREELASGSHDIITIPSRIIGKVHSYRLPHTASGTLSLLTDSRLLFQISKYFDSDLFNWRTASRTQTVNHIHPSRHQSQRPVIVIMSFLTEAAARRLASVPRAVATSGFTTTVPRASFTTSIQLQKTATETVKDGLKTVDRAVSDKLVDGINITSESGPSSCIFNWPHSDTNIRT